MDSMKIDQMENISNGYFYAKIFGKRQNVEFFREALFTGNFF